MKSILLKSIALGLISLSLWSCKKEGTLVVSDVVPAGTLTASTTNVTLTQVGGANAAVTLTYPLATSSGYVVPVTSTLQFALKGKNFASPREIVVTTKSYAPTVSDFNNMILALGAKIGVPAQIEVRLKSGAAANDLTYSNVVTLNATAYLASAWIYVPGNYQGWLPSTADSLVSLTSNKIYTGIIKFDGSGFKITAAKTWDLAYGNAGNGTISTTGGDISSGTAGLKEVTVDLNALTIKLSDVKVWGIIGAATPGGWDTDTDMKYVNDGKGFWRVTLNLTASEYKFREDHKWDNNIGIKDGKLATSNSDNLKITAAGNYTISLNPKTLEYTVVKN
ncbi:SusE domain-containing protein [Pedobacter sp. BMA]|uniref:SusE domain-containing protein n=1 Tax=Pedobacter sp. BMA TaxID=1663685 RepID=UPI00064A373D|nr:SusE domain-containing protein [Pedobacter sp. BMA]KLT66252.1 hypothetical protein AB669_08910 [Pedobacter sp. BMA]